MAKLARTHPYNLFLLFSIVIVMLLGFFWWVKIETLEKEIAMQNVVQMDTVTFTCDSKKSIQATFVNGPSSHIELSLSDGRRINLPQTISADGGRYANWNESFIFWNIGNKAFIEENNQTTFANCLEK